MSKIIIKKQAVSSVPFSEHSSIKNTFVERRCIKNNYVFWASFLCFFICDGANKIYLQKCYHKKPFLLACLKCSSTKSNPIVDQSCIGIRTKPRLNYSAFIFITDWIIPFVSTVTPICQTFAVEVSVKDHMFVDGCYKWILVHQRPSCLL